MKSIIQGLYTPFLDEMTEPDTIKVILRYGLSPYHKIDSVTGIFHPETFEVRSLDLNGLPVTSDIEYNKSHYIVIKHRNSIETWSSARWNSIADTLKYDFTPNSTFAYGSNQVEVNDGPVRFAIYSGDVNQDGVIDGSDLSLIDNDAFNFSNGYLRTDLDGNRFIDASDAALAENNAANFVTALHP